MNIDLEQKKLDIIKNAILTNERYNSNEDLYDKFLEEVIKRGFIIFKSMDLETESAMVYLNKIVGSSMIFVLEQESRMQNSALIKEHESTEKKKSKYEDVKVSLDFEYTPVVAGANIKPAILQKLYDTVLIANAKSPEKEYLQLYTMRYFQKMSLSEISKKLNMDTEIVSKNLFELMEEVRGNLE